MAPVVALQVDSLTKRFGELVAVDNLSLEVYEGEVFGLLGPNGAGKTTSIKMMCGLLLPDKGQVEIHGQLLAGKGLVSLTQVGVCHQQAILWPRLTCLEQLHYVGRLYGLPRPLSHRRSARLIEELDLVSARNQLAGTLSGGLERRLNLALAIVHDPEIVILDEPEAGLDPRSRIRVREFVKRLAQHKTIILTTHNMDEADRLADRVAIIDQGQLLVVDTPERLKRRVGEGDVLEITVNDSRTALEELQKRLTVLQPGSQVLASQDTITIRALNAVNLLVEIMDTLGVAGVLTSDVRLRQNTLEDVFVRLTGRGLKE